MADVTLMVKVAVDPATVAALQGVVDSLQDIVNVLGQMSETQPDAMDRFIAKVRRDTVALDDQSPIDAIARSFGADYTITRKADGE